MFSAKAFIACAIGLLSGNAIGGTFVGTMFAAIMVTSLHFRKHIKRATSGVRGVTPSPRQ